MSGKKERKQNNLCCVISVDNWEALREHIKQNFVLLANDTKPFKASPEGEC
jgi:hypothetical protein